MLKRLKKQLPFLAKFLASASYWLLAAFVLALIFWPLISKYSKKATSLSDVLPIKLPQISRFPPILALRDFISPPPVLPWLSTTGNRIVNEKGEPVILRGVNISSIHWGMEEWNPKATEFAIKSWKAQVVRSRVYQDDYLKNPTAFFDQMETEIISPARRAGAYVVLHPWIGKNDPLPDSGTIQMWQAIAAHYKDDPNILYDVLAEPHNVTKKQVRDAYITLIEAVRKVHPRSLIFVSGLGWGREINSYLADPLPYPNIVYRSNPYNRPGEFESLFGKIAQVYPVFLGEFGADGYPPMTRDSVRALLDYADQLGLGWTAWNFHSQGCPCLLSDYKKFTPSSYGSIIKDALLVHAQVSAPPASIPPLAAPEVLGILDIYTEGLEHGFVDLSWETNVDLLSKEEAYQGETSLRAEFKTGYAGIFLHTYNLVSTEKFSRLEFFLNFKDPGPFPLQIALNDFQGFQLKNTILQEYLAPQESGWMKASIPLSDLGAENTEISGVVIQDTSGSPHGPIYIDGIRLVK
jgi:endoglucanase